MGTDPKPERLHKLIKLGRVAAIIGVDSATVRRWVDEGCAPRHYCIGPDGWPRWVEKSIRPGWRPAAAFNAPETTPSVRYFPTPARSPADER